MEYNLSFLEGIRIINKQKWMIILLTCVGIFVTAAYTSTIPRTYTATAIVLLPMENNAVAQISSVGQMLGVPSISATSSSEKLIVALLRSKKMAEDIEEKFDIQNIYGIKSKYKAAKLVMNMLYLYSTEKGITLSIEIKAKDPKLAADIANFCISNLDKMNQEFGITSQKQIVKMFDPAMPPLSADSRGVQRKAALNGIFSLLIGILLALFFDYIKRVKK